MKSITTFLMFVGDKHGKAEEAIRFYVSLFERSKIDRLEKYGKGEGEQEGTVKHASFTLNGQRFMAMDSGRAHNFTFTPSISLFVECESHAEIDKLYKGLSNGGQVLMEFQQYPFAQKFAWVNDRYGVSWQLILR